MTSIYFLLLIVTFLKEWATLNNQCERVRLFPGCSLLLLLLALIYPRPFAAPLLCVCFCLPSPLHELEELFWNLLQNFLGQFALGQMLAEVHGLAAVTCLRGTLINIVEFIQEVPLVVVHGANQAENDGTRIFGELFEQLL